MTERKKPRFYQQEAIAANRRDHEKFDRTLLVMATGTGKTFTLAEWLNEVWEPGDRALFVVHKADLMNQAYWTFGSCGPQAKYGRVQGAEHADYHADIIFGTVQSMNGKRIDKMLATGPFKWIMVDEVHHYVDNEWMDTVNKIAARCPGYKMTTVTATHRRADMKSVGIFLPDIGERRKPTYYYGIRQAIADKYLAPFDPYILETKTDISQLTLQPTGAYGTEQEWKDLYETSNWGKLLVEKTVEPEMGGLDMLTLLFMPSVFVSREIARWVGQEYGIITGHVDADGAAMFSPMIGDMAEISVEDAYTFFQQGKIRWMFNYGIYGEGTDFPYVERIVAGRPVKSESLYEQMLGRGLRWPEELPNKVCLLLHVGFEGHLIRDWRVIDRVNTKATEKLKREIGDMVIDDLNSSPTCPKCGGDLMPTADADTYRCAKCGITMGKPREVVTSQELFDPSALDGMGANARRLQLLAEESASYLFHDNIYSVWAGVGESEDYQRDSLRILADRTFLIIPQGRVRTNQFVNVLVVVYKPVINKTWVQPPGRFMKGWWNYKTKGMFYDILATSEDNDPLFVLADKFINVLGDAHWYEKDKGWRGKDASLTQVQKIEELGFAVPRDAAGKPKLKRGKASDIQNCMYARFHLKKESVLA